MNKISSPSKFSLEQYNTMSNMVKKVYGDNAMTYTDYDDLVYIYFDETYLDFHESDFSVINNDKVIFIGKKFHEIIKKLEKILIKKKLDRLI